MARLFRRRTELEVGFRKISSDDLDIQFTVEGSTEERSAATADIAVYNLAGLTRQFFAQGAEVALRSGYEEDLGPVFLGKVERVEEEREGPDTAVRIFCTASEKELIVARVNASYPKGARVVDAARDQFRLAGVPVGRVGDSPAALERALVFTAETTVSDNLGELASMAGFQCFARLGVGYFVSPSAQIAEAHLLGPGTGLLTVEHIEDKENAGVKKLRVTSLLLWQVQKGSYIQLDSLAAKGLCRVLSYQHRSNESDHLTVMEAAPA